jgi:drug/metabolite transporter (DMT)-like permease
MSEVSSPALAARPAPALTGLYLKLTAMALAWAGCFVAGRVLAQTMPHLVAATGRYLIASLCLVLLAFAKEGGLPRLSLRQLAQTAALGATGVFLYNYFFMGALGYLPASRTALIVALNPGMTALAVLLVFGERLAWFRWVGLAGAFCGVAVVLSRGDLSVLFSQGIGVGELLMMGGAAAWAVYTIVGRMALRGLSPLAATTYAALWGALFLGCGAAAEWQDFAWSQLTVPNLLAIAYLGTIGTALSFVWYYEGVKAIGPTRTAVFNNAVPVFGALLGVTLLDEPLYWSMVVGGLIALAGVMLVNRPNDWLRAKI